MVPHIHSFFNFEPPTHAWGRVSPGLLDEGKTAGMHAASDWLRLCWHSEAGSLAARALHVMLFLELWIYPCSLPICITNLLASRRYQYVTWWPSIWYRYFGSRLGCVIYPGTWTATQRQTHINRALQRSLGWSWALSLYKLGNAFCWMKPVTEVKKNNSFEHGKI